MVEWIRIHLPVQGTRVQSLVREDSICLRAAKPVLNNKRSHHSEKPTHTREWTLLTATRESPGTARRPGAATNQRIISK